MKKKTDRSRQTVADREPETKSQTEQESADPSTNTSIPVFAFLCTLVSLAPSLLSPTPRALSSLSLSFTLSLFLFLSLPSHTAGTAISAEQAAGQNAGPHDQHCAGQRLACNYAADARERVRGGHWHCRALVRPLPRCLRAMALRAATEGGSAGGRSGGGTYFTRRQAWQGKTGGRSGGLG